MKNIKVAFYVYPVAFQSPGGGEVMLLKTKQYLERNGVSVKLFDPWHDKLRDFDILHTFGSVKDALRMMETAKDQGTKNVLSTVCWYSLKAAWGAQSTLSQRALGVARHITKSVMPWFPSQRRRMMQVADLLLPNSRTEKDQLMQYFGVPSNKIQVIPNGVDERFLSADASEFLQRFNIKNFVLCVGRIEPRKNTLNVIRAMNEVNAHLVIVGDYVPQYRSYYEACKKAAHSNVIFTGPIEHESTLLSSAYAACDTFLLATWLETPGLAALEAALAGAKLVITQEGATREYFRDYALYTNPASVKDIRIKVQASLKRPKTSDLQQHVKNSYLWNEVALQTIESYQSVLDRS